MKNCDRGHSFSLICIRTDPKPVNNFFIYFLFFCVQKTVSIFVNTRTKSHESVTVARGQIEENLARANKQSECRIRYRAF